MPFPLDTFANPAGAYSLPQVEIDLQRPGDPHPASQRQPRNRHQFPWLYSGLGMPDRLRWRRTRTAPRRRCFMKTWYDQSAMPVILSRRRSEPADVDIQLPRHLPAAGVRRRCRYRRRRATILRRVLPRSAVWRKTITAPIARSCTPATSNSRASRRQWYVYNGSVVVAAPAATAVWHAAAGVINGAASALNIDGSTVTGKVAPAPLSGLIVTGVGGSCSVAELVPWSEYALTAAERTALVANQKSFWGTP